MVDYKALLLTTNFIRYGKYQGRIIGGDFVNSQGKTKKSYKKRSQ